MFDRKPDSSLAQPTYISSIADIRKRREEGAEKTATEKDIASKLTADELNTTSSITKNIKADTKGPNIPKEGLFSKISSFIKKKLKIFIILICLAIFALAIFIFKLDGLLFPANISGIITDNNSKAISYAKVCYDNKCTVTDVDGKYLFSNVIYGVYALSVEAKNFSYITSEIIVNRSDTSEMNFLLEPLATGDLVIPLITSNGTEINSTEMKIFIDNQEIPLVLDSDSRFYIKDLSLNNYKLRILTPLYIDIEENVTIKQGLNDFSQIILKPAIDLEVKTIDWLNKSPVSKPIVIINDKKTVANAVGILKVHDMPYVSNITIKAIHNSYVGKEMVFRDVKPGVLPVPSFEMIQATKVLFQSSKAGRQNVYSIYLDGSGEVMISGNKGDNIGLAYSRTFQNIYFFSTRDNIKNAYGSLVPIPYTSPLSFTVPIRIAKTDYQDNGSIGTYNFQAQKRVFSKSATFDNSEIYFGPIDGTGTETLFAKTGGIFKSFQIPDNGRFITYSWQDKYLTDNNAGIFIYDLSTRKERELFKTFKQSATLHDISSNQKYLLATITDPLSNQQDLYTININETVQTRTTNTPELETYAQFSGNNLFIYYITTENGMNDVFRARRDGSSKEKITKEGNITSFILGRNDLVLYVSNATLFAVDPKYPEYIQRVTQPVSNFYSNIDVH